MPSWRAEPGSTWSLLSFECAPLVLTRLALRERLDRVRRASGRPARPYYLRWPREEGHARGAEARADGIRPQVAEVAPDLRRGRRGHLPHCVLRVPSRLWLWGRRRRRRLGRWRR